MNRLISISCCCLLKKTLVITTNLTYPESASDRTNDTDTGAIYDTASLLNIILCGPRDFHSVCKSVGIRENFLCTLHKKEIPIASCCADDN